MNTLIAILFILIGSVFFSILYMISLQPKALSNRIGDKAYFICGLTRMISMIFEILIIIGYILFVLADEYNNRIVYNSILSIRLFGIIFTLIDLVFLFVGVFAAGKEAAIPNKETKLYTGIYKVMRHPQTLAEILTWFGIALILNSLTLLIYSLIFIPMFTLFTVIEDNDLLLRFGKDYLEYMNEVGIFWKKKVKKFG